jgi:hypothetical protein
MLWLQQKTCPDLIYIVKPETASLLFSAITCGQVLQLAFLFLIFFSLQLGMCCTGVIAIMQVL